MQLTIKGNPKEIADLVLGIQNRQIKTVDKKTVDEWTKNVISEAFTSLVSNPTVYDLYGYYL